MGDDFAFVGGTGNVLGATLSQLMMMIIMLFSWTRALVFAFVHRSSAPISNNIKPERNYSIYCLISFELYFLSAFARKPLKVSLNYLLNPCNTFSLSSFILCHCTAWFEHLALMLLLVAGCSQETCNLLCAWWNNKNVYFPYIDFYARTWRDYSENESLFNNNHECFPSEFDFSFAWLRPDSRHYGWK